MTRRITRPGPRRVVEESGHRSSPLHVVKPAVDWDLAVQRVVEQLSFSSIVSGV